LTTSIQGETNETVKNRQLEDALDLVRGYQSHRFVELMRGMTMDEHAQTIHATNIMR
jgi:hypothetical protein